MAWLGQLQIILLSKKHFILSAFPQGLHDAHQTLHKSLSEDLVVVSPYRLYIEMF